MEDCLFCKIIKGEIPSKTVYEDEIVKVFLDINPSTNGDLLIIPKKHYNNICDVDDEIITHSLNLTREKLYPLLKEKLNCEGLTIVENNDLGQDIKHFHIHLTPRYKDDNLSNKFNKDILIEIDEVFKKLTQD